MTSLEDEIEMVMDTLDRNGKAMRERANTHSNDSRNDIHENYKKNQQNSNYSARSPNVNREKNLNNGKFGYEELVQMLKDKNHFILALQDELNGVKDKYARLFKEFERRSTDLRTLSNTNQLQNENEILRNKVTELQERIDFMMLEQQVTTHPGSLEDSLDLADLKTDDEKSLPSPPRRKSASKQPQRDKLHDSSISESFESETLSPPASSRKQQHIRQPSSPQCKISNSQSSMEILGLNRRNFRWDPESSIFGQSRNSNFTNGSGGDPNAIAMHAWREELDAEMKFMSHMTTRKKKKHDDTLFQLWDQMKTGYIERDRVLKQLDALVAKERDAYAYEQIKRLRELKRSLSTVSLHAIEQYEDSLKEQEAIFRLEGESRAMYRVLVERRKLERIVRKNIKQWEVTQNKVFYFRGFPYIDLIALRNTEFAGLDLDKTVQKSISKMSS